MFWPPDHLKMTKGSLWRWKGLWCLAGEDPYRSPKKTLVAATLEERWTHIVWRAAGTLDGVQLLWALRTLCSSPEANTKTPWGVILLSITMKGEPEYEFVYVDTQRLTETQDFKLKFQNCQSNAVQRTVVISRAGGEFWVHVQTQVMGRVRWPFKK